MTTQRSADSLIAHRIGFKASALRGTFPQDAYDPARMDQAEWMTMRAYLNAHDVDYIVLSYETPIAYHTISDGWVQCRKKHSVTTSKHQGIVGRAIAQVSA